MIVLINGPLGVGKTSAAWGVLERLERGAMLDLDHIVAIHPFDFYDRDQLDYAFRTVELLARHHVESGYPDLVIDWVIERADDHARLVERLAPLSPPLIAVHLTASLQTIRERVRARNRRGVDWELDRAARLTRILDEAGPGAELGVRIDTTELATSRVVDEILALRGS